MFKIKEFLVNMVGDNDLALLDDPNFVRHNRWTYLFLLLIYFEKANWMNTSTWACKQGLGKICFDSNKGFPDLLRLKTESNGNTKKIIHIKRQK